MAKAMLNEVAPPPVAPDMEARRRHEQRMDELVDSILRGIGRSVGSESDQDRGGDVVPGKRRAMI